MWPVDIQRSEEKCTIEKDGDTLYVRLGFNYLRGLRGSVAQSIVAEQEKRPFVSLRDLVLRVPDLNRKEMAALAEIGALNALPKEETDRHRRGAMWQASAAVRNAGPLLEDSLDEHILSPLPPMTPVQRTRSDFARSGLTIGQHPMAFHRERLRAMGIMDSEIVKAQRNGTVVRIVGCHHASKAWNRQRLVFLSLEDETGVVNVIVNPDIFDRYGRVCIGEPYLLIKGVLQNSWCVISVKAAEMESLSLGAQMVPSHDFH